MDKRFRFLRILLVVATLVIGARLFFVQIIDHDEWAKKAEMQHSLQNTLLAKRGNIYMMDGDEPVEAVMNETVYTIIIDPMIADKERVEKIVSENAGDYVVAEWKDVFADKNLRYYIVAKNVPRNNAKKIEEAELVGVWLQQGTKRVYPEGEMASGLLGFVNSDGEGQYGVEGALNEELSGKNGLLRAVKDINGIALSIGDENVLIPAKDGENVVLSIDKNIQFFAEKTLMEKLDDVDDDRVRASAVVMNPRNGKILAVANVPNYDPANYSEVEDASDYKNFAFEEAYEPASVCKTFTFAAAIDTGAMTPDTTFTNNGYTIVNDTKIKNVYTGAIGTATMQTALNYSLNTGSTQALRLIGGDPNNINEKGMEILYKYYHDNFGFGQLTNVELLETEGYVPTIDSGYAMDLTYANMTFGQGVNISMVQLASAFSSVVNGGNYYKPTVIAGKIEDGVFVKNDENVEPVRTTISEETSETMREMLYGTRYNRRSSGVDKSGYYVGGKTGTGQVIIERSDGTWGYSEATGETIASYVGFGGVEEELPEYVIMVKIWGEGRHFEGEKDALPLFDTLSNFMLDYLKIKPKD